MDNLISKFFGSVPIVGPGLVILITHTEAGIAEKGKVIGLLRGLITGLVLMGALIAISEAMYVAFDLIRYPIGLYYTEPIKARMRAKVAKENEDKPIVTDDPGDTARQTGDR